MATTSATVSKAVFEAVSDTTGKTREEARNQLTDPNSWRVLEILKKMTEEEFQQLQDKAKLNDKVAQYELGCCYFHKTHFKLSDSFDPDVAALTQFRLSAEQGFFLAGYYLAQMYFKGIGVQKDRKQAHEWFTRSEEQGSYDSALALGYWFASEKYVPKDLGRARKYFEKAARNKWGKENEAQYQLGVFYQYGLGVKVDYIKSFDYYTQSAKQEFIPAIRALALCWEKGLHQGSDLNKAYELYTKAAEKEADAHYDLARWKLEGTHIEKNVEEGMRMLESLDRINHRPTKLYLSRYYLLDREKAISSFRNFEFCVEKADGLLADALVEPYEAYYYLSFCYALGIGTSKNLKQSLSYMQLLENAVERGEDEAKYWLARCYENKHGPKFNLKKALPLYDTSWGLNFEEGQKKAEKIRKGLYDLETAVSIQMHRIHREKESDWKLLRIRDNLISIIAEYAYEKPFVQPRGIGELSILSFDKKSNLIEDALLDDAVAQYELAFCFENGTQSEISIVDAFRFYAESAKNGFPQAKEALNILEKKIWEEYERAEGFDGDDADNLYKMIICIGNRYYEGEYVEQNYEKAVKFFRAVEGVDSGAQYRLGMCIQKGQGVKADAYVAYTLFQSAAKAGYADAERALAECYQKGKGVKEDAELAFQYYKRAADKKDAAALYAVGECYQRGYGVAKDLIKMAEYFNLAASLGYKAEQHSVQDLLLIDFRTKFKNMPPLQGLDQPDVGEGASVGVGAASSSSDPSPSASPHSAAGAFSQHKRANDASEEEDRVSKKQKPNS